jgi:hypothetical protein
MPKKQFVKHHPSSPINRMTIVEMKSCFDRRWLFFFFRRGLLNKCCCASYSRWERQHAACYILHYTSERVIPTYSFFRYYQSHCNISLSKLSELLIQAMQKGLLDIIINYTELLCMFVEKLLACRSAYTIIIIYYTSTILS